MCANRFIFSKIANRNKTKKLAPIPIVYDIEEVPPALVNMRGMHSKDTRTKEWKKHPRDVARRLRPHVKIEYCQDRKPRRRYEFDSTLGYPGEGPEQRPRRGRQHRPPNQSRPRGAPKSEKLGDEGGCVCKHGVIGYEHVTHDECVVPECRIRHWHQRLTPKSGFARRRAEAKAKSNAKKDQLLAKFDSCVDYLTCRDPHCHHICDFIGAECGPKPIAENYHGLQEAMPQSNGFQEVVDMFNFNEMPVPDVQDGHRETHVVEQNHLTVSCPPGFVPVPSDKPSVIVPEQMQHFYDCAHSPDVHFGTSRLECDEDEEKSDDPDEYEFEEPNAIPIPRPVVPPPQWELPRLPEYITVDQVLQAKSTLRRRFFRDLPHGELGRPGGKVYFTYQRVANRPVYFTATQVRKHFWVQVGYVLKKALPLIYQSVIKAEHVVVAGPLPSEIPTIVECKDHISKCHKLRLFGRRKRGDLVRHKNEPRVISLVDQYNQYAMLPVFLQLFDDVTKDEEVVIRKAEEDDGTVKNSYVQFILHRIEKHPRVLYYKTQADVLFNTVLYIVQEARKRSELTRMATSSQSGHPFRGSGPS